MKIKRLSIVLPAGQKKTAAHDARLIAEAVGRAVRESGGSPATPVSINAQGRNAASIALETSSRIRTAAFNSKRGGG